MNLGPASTLSEPIKPSLDFCYQREGEVRWAGQGRAGLQEWPRTGGQWKQVKAGRGWVLWTPQELRRDLN